MAIQTVGVLMPGDMGHTIGQALRERGISDLADDATLVREADLVLAIVVPAQARTVAARLAAACRATGADLLYADCNAIAPQTTRAIADLLTAAGVRYVDASIIGSTPGDSEWGRGVGQSPTRSGEGPERGPVGCRRPRRPQSHVPDAHHPPAFPPSRANQSVLVGKFLPHRKVLAKQESEVYTGLDD